LGAESATAATAIFPLSAKSLRLKDRIVNLKKPRKYFVKWELINS
jgi:hypothetical protein